MSRRYDSSAHVAVLRGADHPEFGHTSVLEVDPSIAVAMSAGARKRRNVPVDPNEDVGAVVSGPDAALLVVADAHFGREASHIAVDHLLDAIGDAPPRPDLSAEQLEDLFHSAGVAVQRETTRAGSRHPDTRTTMAFALVNNETVQWASLGDSCVVMAGSRGCARVDVPRAAYLGNAYTHADVAAALTCGRAENDGVSCVICATDGLADAFGSDRELERTIEGSIASSTRAAHVADRLVNQALSAGIADAVTIAVFLR